MENTKRYLLLDQISRQIVIKFRRESEAKSKLWIWWNKNIIVTQHENTKAIRNLDKSLKELEQSLYNAVERICKLIHLSK